MPCDLNKYPPYWRQFSRYVRFERARGRCECRGYCGLHGGIARQNRCTEVHGRPAAFANGRVILSTAHLCNCDPPCANHTHVIAACQRCHLRIDIRQHVESKRKNGTLYLPPWYRTEREADGLEPFPQIEE